MAQAEWSAERLRVPASEWIERLETEYLSDYVRSGGSVVKVVSGSNAVLARVKDALCSSARRNGYLFAGLDPAKLLPGAKKPDLHHIDRFFFQTTREVDWKEWAAAEARAFLDSRGIHVGRRPLNDLEGIASDNGRDARDLHIQYETQFATPLIKDHSLAIEFRTALTALSRVQLVPESMTPTTEEVLLNWLAGRTMPGAAAALKRIHIFGRIDRSNARHMLSSFCRWLPRTGRSGLCIVLDLRSYQHIRKTAVQRKNETLERVRNAVAQGADQDELAAILAAGDAEQPVSYSQAAYMQMLQMLRRFIDEIDWFERLCVVVLTSPSFYDETSDRNYIDYEALQTRIGLEVHDALRANPIASLVHLAETT